MALWHGAEFNARLNNNIAIDTKYTRCDIEFSLQLIITSVIKRAHRLRNTCHLIYTLSILTLFCRLVMCFLAISKHPISRVRFISIALFSHLLQGQHFSGSLKSTSLHWHPKGSHNGTSHLYDNDISLYGNSQWNHMLTISPSTVPNCL